MDGVVKRKIDGKDFGFITPDGETQDVFFHKSALADVTFEELQEGDKVSFDVVDSPKGDGKKNAANVKRM